MNSKPFISLLKEATRFGWPFFFVLLAGCSRFELSNRLAAYDNLITTHNLVSENITAGDFVLRTARRPGDSSILRFYIEGDGFGWKHPTEPSANPTPVNPVALQIALHNDGSPWVYLARPCQYTMAPTQNCTWRMWTRHVYSQKALDSLSAAIDHYKKFLRPKAIELIGYSGGGTMALLLKAHRKDITKVTTIASNIDVLAWSEAHNQLTLIDSLNPADFMGDLCGGRYKFIWGDKDKVVPRQFFSGLIEKLKQCAMVKEQVISATHYEGWQHLKLDIGPAKN